MLVLFTVLFLITQCFGFVHRTSRLLRISQRSFSPIPQIRNEIHSTTTLQLETKTGPHDGSAKTQHNMFNQPADTPTTENIADQIDLLYDSDCPICQMEVDFLRKRDINHRIRFTDLSNPDYDPAQHGNVRFEDGMRKIRAVLPSENGEVVVVTGVEVFRQTYKAIGLGWIFELTNFPVIGTLADLAYDVWAENRLRITGRGELADVLKERSAKLREADPVDCDADGCALYFGDDEVEEDMMMNSAADDRSVER